MPDKLYSNRLKFRCVLTILFDPCARDQERREMRRDAGYTEDEITARLGPPPPRLSAVQLIRRSIEHDFSEDRKGEYRAQRFNTADEPVFYTASDEITATDERQFHWEPKTEDCRYVVFTVGFSGKARDIRPDVADGVLDFPEDYGPSQIYATEARRQALDAIAAPSKRTTAGGSCCAIFQKRAITPLDLVGEKSFAIH
jgi:hypothetical protein